MKYLKLTLIWFAIFGSIDLAFAWNPFEKKQCTKESSLKQGEYKQIERKLFYRGGMIGGTLYHQHSGPITCGRIHIDGKDGKTKAYNTNWVVHPNIVTDLQLVRVLENGGDYALECTCERIEGLGDCVGYLPTCN